MNQTAIAERADKLVGLEGPLSASAESLDLQVERILGHLEAKPTNLARYINFIGPTDRNETLFYRTRTEKLMSKFFGCLFAGLFAAALTAAPAMAREHRARSWHDKNGTIIDSSRVVHISGRHCIRAPDVGAFASDPYRQPPCEPARWY
ncbi:hypothetical protein ACVIGB_004274 [Bradyrhizobium sp. USDA 4341]